MIPHYIFVYANSFNNFSLIYGILLSNIVSKGKFREKSQHNVLQPHKYYFLYADKYFEPLWCSPFIYAHIVITILVLIPIHLLRVALGSELISRNYRRNHLSHNLYSIIFIDRIKLLLNVSGSHFRIILLLLSS